MPLDTSLTTVCICRACCSEEGGLAVLYGNLAQRGCIVKTAGVDPGSWCFRGPAVVIESQEAAVEAILGGRIQPGDVVVIRYEGPRGGNIALIENGDVVVIDIPKRLVCVEVGDDELARRRARQVGLGWKPAKPRKRHVSAALKAYAHCVTSADTGAVRNLDLLENG